MKNRGFRGLYDIILRLLTNKIVKQNRLKVAMTRAQNVTR